MDLGRWLKPIIQATREAKIGRIRVQGSQGKKVHKTPTQTMAGVVVCTCHPSSEGKNRYVQASLGIK
jgi:hypothetical protein